MVCLAFCYVSLRPAATQKDLELKGVPGLPRRPSQDKSIQGKVVPPSFLCPVSMEVMVSLGNCQCKPEVCSMVLYENCDHACIKAIHTLKEGVGTGRL